MGARSSVILEITLYLPEVSKSRNSFTWLSATRRDEEISVLFSLSRTKTGNEHKHLRRA